ncbi:MAG: PBSX family phage terminase large subunit [Gammaproteobacteria bacterium]|nr:PBSX family phage terminase large subunit [Gammaproteobacteria bacterium]
MHKAKIRLPPKLAPMLSKRLGSLRYRCAYGGRGSGKSFSFALTSAVCGYYKPIRILCTRDLQVSIKESFHAELKAAIESQPWLADRYEVGESFIRGNNGTEFIFKGLRHNIKAIKSTANIDLCIVEEAEGVPERSWVDLIPTIRKDGSEIWVIWNPESVDSPVERRFRNSARADLMCVEVNHSDNPWFPKVLEDERREDQQTMDDALYAHIWEGAHLVITDAQVLKGKYRTGTLQPDHTWDGPYYGVDWGFSVDPSTMIKSFIKDKILYIAEEAYGAKVEINDTPVLFDRVTGGREHVSRADCARPEMISYHRNHGYPRMMAAKKWEGSEKDGITFLRSFERIVIHPDCRHTLNEARLWSYKVDRESGDPMPILIDKNNHCWDAMRYALEPIIRQRRMPKVAGFSI